jgi:hypothetical protein
MDTPIFKWKRGEAILQHDVQIEDPPSQAQMDQWTAQWKPDGFVRLILDVGRRRLLPQAWIYGFFYTYATSLVRPAFLCGKISLVGWWYYFPLAMLFKTPLATLSSMALALAVGISSFRLFKIDSRNLISFLVAPAIYFISALRTHLNIGLRHILPVYPFLSIAVGVMAAMALRRWPRYTAIVLAGLALCLVLETSGAYPDYIPYFNEACGARGGLALLGDSNLDWGQELFALADWMRAHPDRQLYFCSFGMADPKYYQLHYIMLPGSLSGFPDQTRPNHGYPVIALSPTALQGQFLPFTEYGLYAPYRHAKPIAVRGGALYLFDPFEVRHNP